MRKRMHDSGRVAAGTRGRRHSVATYAVISAAAGLALGLGIVLALASLSTPIVPASSAVASSMPASETPAAQSEQATEAPTAPAPAPDPPIAFGADAAMDTIRSLESFGVRKGGSTAEHDAALWLQEQLRALGYDARIEDVPLPDGTTSHNVIARSTGTSARVVVLGSHMDTKPPSPGANDNASGCAATLEIARILAQQPVVPTVELIFFGAEEIIDGNAEHHHFGSRARVAAMSAAERANIAGMISIDMIAYGPDFHSRMMRRGPEYMSDLVLARAAATGVRMTFLKDPGSSGWSDHEAYELAGIPATWIEWRDDPVYHTAKDTSAHCDPEKVRMAGQLVLDVLRSFDADALEALIAR